MIAPFNGPESWSGIQVRFGPTPARPNNLSMDTLRRDFTDYCLVARNLAPKTIRDYDHDLLDFQRFAGDITIRDLQRELIHGYVRSLFERKLAVATIRRRVATIRVFCSWLEYEQYVPITLPPPPLQPAVAARSSPRAHRIGNAAPARMRPSRHLAGRSNDAL
jgi:site-specific recombinase XerC